MRLTTRSTRRAAVAIAETQSGGQAWAPSRRHAIALDLDPREVEATLQPAGAGDDAAAARVHGSRRPRLGAGDDLPRLGVRGARLPGGRAGELPDARDRHRQRRRDGRRGRPPPRLPQRLPAPRREADRGLRGERPPPGPVPLPRLVLRARRRAQGGAPHGRGRGLRPLVLGPDPGPGRHRGRPGPGRPRRRRSRHRLPPGRARRPSGALPGRLPASRRPGSPTRSRPTGRRSPRTTASACIAPASIRSSTGSATT